MPVNRADLLRKPTLHERSRLSVIADPGTDPAYRLAEGVERACIGEAEITLAIASEARAGDRRHSGLLQKPRLKRPRVIAGSGDGRERVERTAGTDAAEPWDGVQGVDEHGAALGEGGEHPPHRLLAALQRGDAGILRRRID